MIPFAATTELKAALIIAAAAACFGAGWAVEGWRLHAQIAQIRSEHAVADQQRAENNLAAVVTGQQRGDALVERVATEENARTQSQQEKTHELRRLTTGRPCLAGTVVRLLNMPDGIKPGFISQAASESVPADAGAATDSDVAAWIGQCSRGYETCRGRLQAIHDFFGGSAVSDDVVDRAQAREQEMRQDALDKHTRTAQASAAADSAETCAMCGEPIPEGRRNAVPGVQTCVDCQKDVERLGMRVR